MLTLKTWVQLERGQLGSYWLELAFLTWVAFIAFTALRFFFAVSVSSSFQLSSVL